MINNSRNPDSPDVAKLSSCRWKRYRGGWVRFGATIMMSMMCMLANRFDIRNTKREFQIFNVLGKDVIGSQGTLLGMISDHNYVLQLLSRKVKNVRKTTLLAVAAMKLFFSTNVCSLWWLPLTGKSQASYFWSLFTTTPHWHKR